jgi:nucleoside-triphosphatase THEP1
VTARALLLTGTVGVGKTSVAAAVGDLLRDRQVANAVVDLDELRRSWPPASGDRFNTTAVEDLRLDVSTVSVVDAASRVLELWDARGS